MVVGFDFKIGLIKNTSIVQERQVFLRELRNVLALVNFRLRLRKLLIIFDRTMRALRLRFCIKSNSSPLMNRFYSSPF